MSKFGTIEFSGKSGKLYSFNVYSIDTDFEPYSAVYCVTHRKEDDAGHGMHEKLFFGSTEDMSSALKKAVSKLNGQQVNCICAHREESADAREEIKEDLIEQYQPPCN